MCTYQNKINIFFFYRGHSFHKKWPKVIFGKHVNIITWFQESMTCCPKNPRHKKHWSTDLPLVSSPPNISFHSKNLLNHFSTMRTTWARRPQGKWYSSLLLLLPPFDIGWVASSWLRPKIFTSNHSVLNTLNLGPFWSTISHL